MAPPATSASTPARSGGRAGPVGDGEQGVSFVAILGARFTPGIQLGFGFELSAVGGVIGVNVGVDADELRRRLPDGTAVALFFPADPRAGDASCRRCATSSRRARAVVVGPSAELTWLQVAGTSMLRLSLVLLLELPRARVLFSGPRSRQRAADARPASRPARRNRRTPRLLRRRPRRRRGAGDGYLPGGRHRRPADLQRRPAYTLFTIGGFYPGYRTQVPGMPAQQRLSFGPDFPLGLSFRFEGYLAFTGGTFQAGARFEIGFDVGILAAHGFLSFDAIAQLDPFHLHVDLAGGVEVEALGVDFAGVDFHGSLDAPGPVVVRGRVRVSFLGAKASWNDRFVLGVEDGSAPAAPVLDDVAAEVAATVTANSSAAPAGTTRTSGSTRRPGPPTAARSCTRWARCAGARTSSRSRTQLQRVQGRRLAGPRR